MDFKNILIWKFLDENYYIKENLFFFKAGDVHEWGNNIFNSLSVIFNFDIDSCENALKHWAYNLGMTNKAFDVACSPKTLTTSWSPETTQDLQALYGVSDPEQHFISVLTEQIANELNSEILKKLKDKIKTSNDFFSIIKCIGYEPSKTIYDEFTFSPRKYFVSTTFNDMIDERKSNDIWQDYVRPTRADKQT